MRTRDIDKEQLVKRQAIDMLVKDGFEGFSMNKLAKVCGISVATLYIYYQDKDELMKKIGVEIGNNFFANTLKNFSPDMPFAEGLRKQWENRTEFALQFPQEVAFYEIIRHSPHGEHILSQSLAVFGETMHQFFSKAIQSGELMPISVEVFWSMAYGPLYTLLRFHREGKGLGLQPFQLSQEAMDEAFKLVIKALTP